MNETGLWALSQIRLNTSCPTLLCNDYVTYYQALWKPTDAFGLWEHGWVVNTLEEQSKGFSSWGNQGLLSPSQQKYPATQ